MYCRMNVYQGDARYFDAQSISAFDRQPADCQTLYRILPVNASDFARDIERNSCERRRRCARRRRCC